MEEKLDRGVSEMVVSRTGTLAVPVSKRGNSFFIYFLFSFFYLVS